MCSAVRRVPERTLSLAPALCEREQLQLVENYFGALDRGMSRKLCVVWLCLFVRAALITRRTAARAAIWTRLWT